MKLLLLACTAVVGLVVSDPIPSPVFNYHENVGIGEAARIKAAEEAVDFDGSRIVGGSLASLGQYPFLFVDTSGDITWQQLTFNNFQSTILMGGLVITLTTGFTSICGSTLLTNTRAITAAHCWWDGRNQARQFVVVFASLTVFTGGTRITTREVQMHENWNMNTAQNDIAIITFNWINYSNNIRNIGLPTGALAINDFLGYRAFAMGWGLQSDAGTIPNTQQLRHVTLDVIENAVCRSLYGPVIVDSMICARGQTTESTCNGDSGGPFAIFGGSQSVLIGIGAFNHRDSCQRRLPVGFTRVTSYLNWIQSKILW